MIFNRWFWFSMVASVFAQTVQWHPALAADELLPFSAQNSDLVVTHANSPLRETGRTPAIVGNELTPEFLAWTAKFSQHLERTLNRKRK